jgi:putative transposase
MVQPDHMPQLQAYRFAIRPNPEQERVLVQHARAVRFCYNELLREVRHNLDLIRWEERVLGQRISEYLSWSSIALQNLWNQDVRLRRCPWYAENPDDAYRTAFYDILPNALRAWRERRHKGFGFPRPRGRRALPTVTYYRRTPAGKPRLSGHNHEHAELPRVPGLIRLDEHPRALVEELAAGGRVKRASVTRERSGRWYCSFLVERATPKRRSGHAPRIDRIVGVAPGTSDLIVLARPDGSEIPPPVPAPRPYEAALGRLARRQREMSRQRRGSGRYRDTADRLAVLHARVANLRRDYIHKTTQRLANGCDVIALPEMSIMARARWQRERGWRSANRALYDAAIGELMRELGYKGSWAGCHVVMVPRQQWSEGIGTLSGHERQLRIAINLARVASEVVAASGAVTARGGQRETEVLV